MHLEKLSFSAYGLLVINVDFLNVTSFLNGFCTKQVHQLQTSVAIAEESVIEKQRELGQCSRRMTELEKDNTYLRTNLVSFSSRLEETELQLDASRAEKKRLEGELQRTSCTMEELRSELKSSRELMRKYENQRVESTQGSVGQQSANRDDRKQPAVIRTSKTAAASPAAGVLSTPSTAARKLFEVEVKHEKSSSSLMSHMSLGTARRRDVVTDSRHNSPATPTRQVLADDYY